MKIFITGITGFVGSSLANELINHGHQITGLGRKKTLPTHINEKCNYIIADITKPLSIIDADIVIHAAAQVADNVTYQDHYLNNVVGTKNVINACINVRQFILISTSSVYSFKNNKAYLESDAGDDFEQLSNYGKTKFLAEKQLQQATKFNCKIILRPRAIYGVGDTVLLPRLLSLVKGDNIILPAHITEQISLTNIKNLIYAVKLCLKIQSKLFLELNIADEKIYSLKLALPAIINAVQISPKKNIFVPKFVWNFLLELNGRLKFNSKLSVFGSKQLTQKACLNIELAKIEIGFIPPYNFFDELVEIRKWYFNICKF